MHKKSVVFENMDGVTTSEDFYFNISTSEMIKIQASYPEGYEVWLQGETSSGDGKRVIDAFEDLLQKTYGERIDNRHVKSDEAWQRFLSHPAYDKFFMELLTEADAAATFFNAVMPQDLDATATKMQDQAARFKDLEQTNAGAPLVAVAPEPVEQTEIKSNDTSDEELLAMKPQDMSHEQLQRAFALKSQNNGQ